jgi:hypothetical protein
MVTALSAALGCSILFAGASLVFAIAEPPAPAADTPSETIPPYPLRGESAFPAISFLFRANPAQSHNPAPDKETGGETKAFTGMITDSHCGARHSRNSDKTSAECAHLCVHSKGSHYVLVDGEEIHGLQGDRTQLDKLAGTRVNVVGRLVGDTIKVQAISPLTN